MLDGLGTFILKNQEWIEEDLVSANMPTSSEENIPIIHSKRRKQNTTNMGTTILIADGRRVTLGETDDAGVAHQSWVNDGGGA